MKSKPLTKETTRSSGLWKRSIDLRLVPAFSGSMRRVLLGIVTAAIFLETPSVARAGCGEEDMQSELDEPKALTKQGFRTEFRDFVLREFPVGSDGGRLLRWLERSGFGDPHPTYYAVMTLTDENEEKEVAAYENRVRNGTPLQMSVRSFNGLCGRNIYAIYWRFGSCNRIAEILVDQERCQLDLP